MDEFISRKAAITYIREQSEECQKAFEELGGESGIYADAYNDLAEDFYSIPAADVAPVVHGRWAHLGGDEWCCSACGFVITTEGSWDKPTKKYCEDCGAKMDGGDSDEAD
nr:MAG TPA: Rubrerythrin [Caudoviricetes sp.]